MSSLESLNFQDNQKPESIVSEENVALKSEDFISDRFLEILDKNPSVEKIVEGIKSQFNEVETATNNSFNKSLDLAKSPERVRLIELFAEKTGLDYFSLHENFVEMLDLVPDLKEEEREKIIQESEKTLALCEGRTLLSFYANRNPENKKKLTSPDTNTEKAALQQSLAKYYLHHSDKLEGIQVRLDNFGKKALGSEEEYERIKRGVFSLANAYQHLESMGHQVFFPPPEMDARREIDLLYVENLSSENLSETEKAFFNGNFSVEELANLDPSLLSRVSGVQVKTGHNLKETYGNLFHSLDNPEPLKDVLQGASLDESCFDCLSEEVVKKTTVSLSLVRKGVGHCKSLATVFACPSVEKSPYSSNENFYEKMRTMSRKAQEIIKNVQSSVNFSEQVPRGIGSAYVFVEGLSE